MNDRGQTEEESCLKDKVCRAKKRWMELQGFPSVSTSNRASQTPC